MHTSTTPARQGRLVGAVTALLAAGLVLTGCAPSPASAPRSDTSSRPVSTDVASMGDVTLEFLDYSSGTDAAFMTKAIDAFEAAHPNITIDRTEQSFDQVMATLNLRLSEAGGPDVATINNGWQSMGTLAKAGLLLDLDPYADAYGWKEEIPDTILRQHLFTADGATMGEGVLWGTPGPRLTTTGLYVNTSLLAQYGLTAPTSLEQVQAACDRVVAAGAVCVEVGMQEKTFATLPLFTLQAALGDKKRIADFVYHSSDVALSDTGMPQAAQTLQQWAKAGYFNTDASGIGLEASRSAFVGGEGLFHFDYSGSLSGDGVDVSRFARVALPGVGGSAVAVGAPSAPLGVSAKTEHPDAAAAFLDFMASAQMSQLAVDSGMLPIDASQVTPPQGTVFGTEVVQTQQVADDDGFVPFFDWASPNMLDVIGGQAQLVFAGTATPDALVTAAQDDYDQFHAGR